ncbi:hypothetical protein NLM59_07345 [Weeksellaceae bacterium KMM 9724]|uniref:hypothetical protein n=1 Tax=Profundicola chukchiensis TaxID=2961959 RepID=UPI00243D7561|nr:hypothetical protein [Profundicola chukchiensis]MDG4950735.1 hypothetical protein [Profundicola chukchiensis]
MIDNWFKKDIENIWDTHSIVVVIDVTKESWFLLDSLGNDVTIFKAKDELEELKIKYEIEKSNNSQDKFIIYTTTPREDLKFIREYTETHGTIEISRLDTYIKNKVKVHLNLNINLGKEELISAAKVSIGKTETYWLDLSHKGSSEIFDLEKELLPFLHDPKSFSKKYDESTQEIFYKKISELIEQIYVKKPVSTLATEVVHHLLDGLIKNNIHPTLLNVYNTWIDSYSYKDSLLAYIDNYKTGQKEDLFEVHVAHPFKNLDIQWFIEIGKHISDKAYVDKMLPLINQRNGNKVAKSLNILFWNDVKVILEFDEKNINQISSFQEAVDFYLKHFYKLDRAIRKLYSEFLTQRELIEPWQLYYKNLSNIFLDKWFKYIEDYSSNQTGRIQQILNKHSSKTAIIVGDGVAWEFSKDIIDAMGHTEYELTSDYMLAGLPSETEHNMSQLYVDSGEVFSTKKEREEYLTKNNADLDLGFIDLDNVNETTDKVNFLICSCKDPDKLGETYQQQALKYFDSVANTYAAKIKQLLRNGYKQVYLLTDHGYTLTGILDNSDKIEVQLSSDAAKNERYIRTKKRQEIDDHLMMEISQNYSDYEYCYFSKRLGPFKTPGVYGFSHGGISPQETLIPYLKWTNTGTQEDLLEVVISNKSDLKDITGNIYSIKLKGNAEADNLFAMQRKVFLMFFADGKEINKSDIFTIEKGEELKKEYQFDSHQQIEVKILDANTKQQLDKAIITQSSARDLGGLF